MKPVRVQLRRARGWRLPANTLCVTRPGIWGNPFRVGGWYRLDPPGPPAAPHYSCGWRQSADPGAPGFILVRDHAMAVRLFARVLSRKRAAFEGLRGKNLACWCPPGGPCHADVLLERANS